MHPKTLLSPLLAVALLSTAASAQDWPNYGGNNARNGQSGLAGPKTATALWANTSDYSLISWHPFIEDGRVITVRESGFPQNGGSANDAIVAYDLYTGVELWNTVMSFGGDTNTEWIAWVGAVRDGRVYASRSSQGKPQPMKAYDSATGVQLWTSVISTHAWAHDGLVFAPNGDVIVGDYQSLSRLNAATGATVWSTVRACPVSGNCGAAGTDTALYVDEPAVGGNKISKHDMATGALLYSSSVMPGFTDQNQPFLSPDGGTVYFSRTQNNPAVDFLYAFEDDGTQFNLLWSREVRWTTSHEHAIGADGGIYTFLPTNEFVRLDPATGAVSASAGILSPIGASNLSAKTAVDVHGTVYVSNGWASNPPSDGHLWAFNADLTQTHFELSLDRQNSGGPALGGDGILVVADRTGVYAYRDAEPGSAFCFGDGSGLACPCGNTGAPGAGCVNTTGNGAVLGSSGSTSLAADDLVLATTQLPANRFGLLFSGTTTTSQLFGDGLRCAGGSLKRFAVQNSGAAGVISQANVPSLAGLGAGETRHYQCWYRDTGGPCASGFNISNGVTVTYRP